MVRKGVEQRSWSTIGHDALCGSWVAVGDDTSESTPLLDRAGAAHQRSTLALMSGSVGVFARYCALAGDRVGMRAVRNMTQSVVSLRDRAATAFTTRARAFSTL